MQAHSHGVVLAPVSPQIAGLLHALQAEMLADIEAANQIVPPGAIVLNDLGAATGQQYGENETHGTRFVRCEFTRGSLSLRNYRTDSRYPSLHGGLWYASEERRDSDGRTWQNNSAGYYVFDDFGALVPVEA